MVNYKYIAAVINLPATALWYITRELVQVQSTDSMMKKATKYATHTMAGILGIAMTAMTAYPPPHNTRILLPDTVVDVTTYQAPRHNPRSIPGMLTATTNLAFIPTNTPPYQVTTVYNLDQNCSYSVSSATTPNIVDASRKNGCEIKLPDNLKLEDLLLTNQRMYPRSPHDRHQ